MRKSMALTACMSTYTMDRRSASGHCRARIELSCMQVKHTDMLLPSRTLDKLVRRRTAAGARHALKCVWRVSIRRWAGIGIEFGASRVSAI